MAFKNIIGQEKVINWLKTAFIKQKLASAYLFVGIEGIGKTSVAINFAKFLNCQKPQNQDSCEQCDSCLKINAGTHPDIILVQAEDDVIKIGQIRDLEQTLSLKPLIAKKRVVIIKQIERMTQEAANAFLKTLEEPPLNTILILTASNKQQLLSTIVSRCQIIFFKPLSLKIIQKALEKKGLDKAKSNLFAILAQGSLGQALKFLDKKIDINWLKIWFNDSIIKTWEELHSVLEKHLQDTQNFEKFLDLSQIFWRDILLIKYGCEDFLINKSFIDGYYRLASRFSILEIRKILVSIEQVRKLFKQNVQKGALLEYIFLKNNYQI